MLPELNGLWGYENRRSKYVLAALGDAFAVQPRPTTATSDHTYMEGVQSMFTASSGCEGHAMERRGSGRHIERMRAV